MVKTSYEIEEEITDEGQLAVDIFENDKELTIIAPIAGVEEKDLKITINDEVLVIQGKRDFEKIIKTFKKSSKKSQKKGSKKAEAETTKKTQNRTYLTQECFFGNFSRSIILPKKAERNQISAEFKNGILKISIPTFEEGKNKIIKISNGN